MGDEGVSALMSFAQILCSQDGIQRAELASKNVVANSESSDQEEKRDSPVEKPPRKRRPPTVVDDTPTFTPPSNTGRKRGRPSKSAKPSSSDTEKAEVNSKSNKRNKTETEGSNKTKKGVSAITADSAVITNVPFNKRALDNDFLIRKSLDPPPHSLSIFDSLFVRTMEEFKKKCSGSVMYKLPPPLSSSLPNSLTSGTLSSFKRFLASKNTCPPMSQSGPKSHNRNSSHVAIAHFIHHQEAEKSKAKPNHNINSVNQTKAAPDSMTAYPFNSGNLTGGMMTPGSSNVTARSNPFNPAAAFNPINSQPLLIQQNNFGFGLPGTYNPAMAAAATYSKQPTSNQQRKSNVPPTKN